jgi:hypothetical protein
VTPQKPKSAGEVAVEISDLYKFSILDGNAYTELVDDIQKALESFAAQKVEEAFEELFKEGCPHCQGATKYLVLHEDKYHTKKGVSPAYENQRCHSENLRAAVKAIRERGGKS